LFGEKKRRRKKKKKGWDLIKVDNVLRGKR
jgi:hypothetical protein